MLSALSDADQDLYCAVMTDPGCMQYVGKLLSSCQAERDFSVVLNLSRQQPVTQFYFKVSLIETGQGIGIASINQLDANSQCADIGRMLLSSWQGQGLGTELSQLLISYLQTELSVDCFTKHIRDGNNAAIQSASKLGFRQVKTSKASKKDGIRKYQLSVSHAVLRIPFA